MKQQRCDYDIEGLMIMIIMSKDSSIRVSIHACIQGYMHINKVMECSVVQQAGVSKGLVPLKNINVV